MIKLVAIDIDDTLTNSAGEIYNPAITAIRKVQDRGVVVVLASARPPQGIEIVARQINENVYKVSYLGALIEDPKGNQIQKLYIDSNIARKITEFADENHISLTITIANTEYHTQNKVRHSFAPRVIIKSASPIISKSGLPTLIGTVGKQSSDTLYEYCISLDSKLINTVRHSYLNDSHSSVVIVNSEAEKGKAILKLCNELSINPEETLAVGDGEGDISMFNALGTSVAVANSEELVRKAASVVAPFPNGSGVKWALEKFL